MTNTFPSLTDFFLSHVSRNEKKIIEKHFLDYNYIDKASLDPEDTENIAYFERSRVIRYARFFIIYPPES